jgi:hypothetical protein
MRLIPRSLAFLPLGAAILGSQVHAQEAGPTVEEVRLQQTIRDLQRELVEARTAGLRTIKVNGVALTPAQVRREAIYLVGAKMVEARMADFFIDEWKERAIKEDGRKPEEFEISEAVIMKELEGQVLEFQTKNPGVEFWEAVRALTGLTKDGYLQQRRQTELFTKVFFPGAAKNWPEITKEAIMASAAGGNGKEFWDNIEKSSVDEQGNARELPAFWMQLCRGWVQKQLKKWSDVRYPSDGLPDNVAVNVNGRDWSVADAFEMVRPGLYYQDLERAMTEVVVREALKQELQKQGAYLSDDEFRKQFDDYRQEYDNTPFTVEVISTAFKGYPSLEAYRQRWRLIQSFQNMIAREINDDTLKAHGERFSRFFSDGQTSVDFIQFLARDIRTGAWTPDGFEAARVRAEAALKEIEGGLSFDKALDKFGEFYQTDEAKGRHGPKPLNQLRQAMRENEFTDVILGYSLGFHLFYDAPEGQVVGPLRGTDAYYLARVNSRTPAKQTVSIAESRTRELVKQDYVTYRFLQWANDVLTRTKVE